MNKKLCLVAISLLLLPVVQAGTVEARVNILSGGVTTSLDYDERTYQGDTREDTNTTRFVISPSIRILSSSEKDEIQFSYAPGYSHDLEESDNYLNHNLTLTANRLFTRQWRMSVSEAYRYTDDPSASSAASGSTSSSTSSSASSDTTSPTLSSDLGRRRYQSNDFNLLSEYTYVRDSIFSLGYTYDILRNEDTGVGGYEDYDRHEGLLGLSYRFNPEWRLSFDGRFVRGLYDPPPTAPGGTPALSRDLKEYRPGFTLASDVFPHDPITLSYNYTGVEYDEELQSDSDIHQITLSWLRELTPRMTFGLGGGASSLKREGQDAEWSPNGHIDFTNSIEHGNLVLGASAGMDQDNFSGTDEQGAVIYWQANGSFNYHFTAQTTGSIFAQYRDEEREDTTLLEYDVQSFSAGASVGYTFLRWYSLSLSYNYTNSESERASSDYEDHRVYLSLGVSKELLRW